MRSRRSWLIALLALACAGPAWAQTQTGEAAAFWMGKAAEIVAQRKQQPAAMLQNVENLINVQALLQKYLQLLHEQRAQRLDLRLVEDARTDKQVGSPASQPGTTSLVSKGSVPGIFGFAVENGALTPSQEGTVITLRGGLIGWLDLVKKQGFIGAYDSDSALARQLRRVSYSFTLDTSQQVEKTEGRPSLDAIKDSFEDAARQIAGYSVRVAIYDRRDPRRKENRVAVDKLLAESQVLQSTDFLDDFFVSPHYKTWLQSSAKILTSPDLADADVERVLFVRLEQLAQLMRAEVPGFDVQTEGFIQAVDAYSRARVAIFDAIHQRPVVAVEYVRARPKDLPDRSTLRFIVEGQFGAWDTTGNMAWTYQHAGTVLTPDPTTIEGTRDFQLAAQFERALGSVKDCIAQATGIGRPVVGIAYLSQHLSSAATVTFAGHDYNVEPGWVHALQAKVTIPVKGSGVKIPVSVSIANRTELIQEKNIRGHIGLTFDMDVITAGFLKR
jgi:hypothetical protein